MFEFSDDVSVVGTPFEHLEVLLTFEDVPAAVLFLGVLEREQSVGRQKQELGVGGGLQELVDLGEVVHG